MKTIKKSFVALLSFVCILFATLFAITACGTPVGGKGNEPDTTGGHESSVVSKSVQKVLLDNAKTYQESVSSAEFISANYDPDLKYVVLT
jgi:hypothetical protein